MKCRWCFRILFACQGFPVYLPEGNVFRELVNWDAVVDAIPESKVQLVVGNGMNLALVGGSLAISIMGIDWVNVKP